MAASGRARPAAAEEMAVLAGEWFRRGGHSSESTEEQADLNLPPLMADGPRWDGRRWRQKRRRRVHVQLCNGKSRAYYACITHRVRRTTASVQYGVSKRHTGVSKRHQCA